MTRLIAHSYACHDDSEYLVHVSETGAIASVGAQDADHSSRLESRSRQLCVQEVFHFTTTKLAREAHKIANLNRSEEEVVLTRHGCAFMTQASTMPLAAIESIAPANTTDDFEGKATATAKTPFS